jgi:hypothetical protein
LPWISREAATFPSGETFGDSIWLEIRFQPTFVEMHK